MSTVSTLSATAFAEKVIEHGLRVVGPYAGYFYIAQETDDGFDMYRTVASKNRYFIQERRVTTQANAGGGPVIIDITFPTGQVTKLIGLRAANSGTNTLTATLNDEDDATIAVLGELASAATTKFHLPSIGGTSGSTGNIINSLGLVFPPGSQLSIYQTGNGAQNDTLTVAYLFEVETTGTPTLPTWAKDRSTNQADVTIAASSISATSSPVTVAVLE